jgi:hypothetical protein
MVFGAATQKPGLAGMLQAWQSFGLLPPHPVEQQTPSSQKLLAHSFGPPQGTPALFFVVHTPPLQNSVDLHSESVLQPPQALPLQLLGAQLWVCGAGHAVLEPVQFAASVTTLLVHVCERQEVAALWYPSGGQLGLFPAQLSATSQTSTAPRQVVCAFAKPSCGQAVLAPEHTSWTSQGPFAGRHTAFALPAGCWHEMLEPLHVSALHGLPSSVHAVPLVFSASAGQLVEAPVHVS